MNPLSKLLNFLCKLEQNKISYTLEHIRDETIMVTVPLPGQLWEVEFFENGDIEVEKFITTTEIGGEELLEDIFSIYAE